MKIATFNAASVRARLPILVEWLATHKPDLLAIQETKVEDHKFPFEDFEDLGYLVTTNGQKSWNGVATLTLEPVFNVQRGFPDELFPQDARILVCECRNIQFINVYAPNGSSVGSDKFAYKLSWFERMHKWLSEEFDVNSSVILMGDINIALKPEDVYNSTRVLGKVGHHPDEFTRLQKIIDWGFQDLFRLHHTEGNQFSFWEFVIPNALKNNLGWRIDHIYATESIADKCTDCWIDVAPRSLDRPSDHTFVVAELAI